MTTQIKAGVIAANAITASELASSALSGGSFTGDVTFDTNTLVIDSTNNRVGIGTTAPLQKLVIDVNSSNTTQLSLDGIVIGNSDTTANNGSAIAFSQSGSNGNSFSRIGVINTDRTASSEDQDMFFGTISGGSYGERMRITSTGNVGIGTSPYFRLDVSGPNYANGDAKNNAMLFDTTSATAGTGGGISFGGYTNGTGSAIFHFGNIQGIKENSTAGDYASAMIFSTRANGATPVEQMRIDSSGNVGIGVTNPQYALDISGGLQFTGASKLTGGYWLCDASQGFRINKSDDSVNNFIVRNDGLTWNKDDLLVGKSSYSDIGAQNARLDVSHNAACIAQFDTTSPNGGYIAISVSDSSKGFIGTGSNIGASNTSDLVVRAATGDLHFKTDQNGTDAIVELANDTATNIHNGIKIYNSTDRNNYTRYFHIGRRNVSSAGLLAYYDPNNSHCDDNSGSSIIDLSGNGYTLTKASTFTHQSVSARSYWVGDGGTNAYAGGSVPLTAYAPIHLSLWVIWEDVNNFNGGFQLNGWQGANSYCYIGGQKEGTSSASWLYGYVGNGTNIPSDQSSSTNRNSTVNSDEWVYLTIQAGWTNSSQGSRTTGRTEVYLNGTLVDSKASQQMAQASSTNFFLGKLSGGYQINGAIGPAVVYKRTLTQAEILDNMRVHQELYMI